MTLPAHARQFTLSSSQIQTIVADYTTRLDAAIARAGIAL